MSGVVRRLAVAASVAVVALFAVTAAGCGSNPNEHEQSNELFRPAAAEASAEQSVVEAEQTDSDTEEDAQDDEVQSSQQDEPAADDSATDDSEGGDGVDAGADDSEPLETAADVVRRYTNPTYGYSFELLCSPFCDPTSNGIERVSFLSETGRALISADVLVDDGTDGEALLRREEILPEGVELSSREPASTVTGEPAERFEWEEDRRATGGFHVRWNVLLARSGGVVIMLRAGGVLDDRETHGAALERALTSFILPLEITARPGRYDRFDFVIDYPIADISQEFGQPTSAPPSEEAGIFVLRSTIALKAVLTWQVLGEAFYDGDTAIEQSLRDSLGIEEVTLLGDWGTVDGNAARSGETETLLGEGAIQIRSFAWYCREGGREFALHVLDFDDPEAVALPLIAGFRCSVDGQ